ncbi:hypothetical protein MIN45_P0135 [Methylomarinovum tepidoasis]|uniref:Glycosyltransferase subfamily 4-like N-terminal domain-containing protein n=1 Tax=Methylomarinovum tepidoasis TaxID=2840183 RepID=A0AAU9CN90_9GAMM|nr:glycosyltransferase family 4 protein [Methylomarinovum sp. IN45]BCX87768.1 hypothetical protein MIN45_P0135 [Methylomarinovum sp. IN45]
MKNKRSRRRILIIVENLPCPFDRRVWQEATTLQKNGYEVSIICPVGKGYDKRYEILEGVHIYRHPLPVEAKGAFGYLVEYSIALFWEFILAWKVFFTRGFDVIHACNPPDNIFLIGLIFKLLGKKFVFDHHDINPELYEAKFGKRDLFYHIIRWWERLTFMTADISIATNESYKKIAIERGRMNPEDVFVVRSGPTLDRLKILPPVETLKNGRKYLVGYVGVIGNQEGIDYLLQAANYIINKKGRKDVHFGIVGSGPALSDMQALAKELGISDYVTFTGRVPDKEMLEMLNTADVCVNPDVGNEMNDKSTMNKIMEYMALGKPIVQFDLTEGKFSAQKASLYAKWNSPEDMAEKILHLLDNPDLRKEMGEYGKKRIENELEWKYEAPKLLRAYEALFSR